MKKIKPNQSDNMSLHEVDIISSDLGDLSVTDAPVVWTIHVSLERTPAHGREVDFD